MNFTTFSVASTNIFPQANSHYGGQLLSEFNLRSREMVSVHPDIKFESGHSFVHSKEDFKVSGEGTSIIEVAPGRGVINGHYIESLVPMTIDLLEANANLRKDAAQPLRGTLEIGIRIFYSTTPTMAGTMLVTKSAGTDVNSSTDGQREELYIGVQLVILPKLTTPIEAETASDVTAHIRLATFTFLNNTISSIINFDDEKQKYIPASRIDNIDAMLSGNYITKTRLQPNELYVFSGKGTDPENGEDTWCSAVPSLMIWDDSPILSSEKPSIRKAQFGIDSADKKVKLFLPHMQVDGSSTYYQPVSLELPSANFENGTPGVVDKSYTDTVKYIKKQLNEIHQMVNGKQVGYLDTKDANTELPTINQDSWNVGDYILVNQDLTVDDVNDAARAPSTLYVILPGKVESIKFSKSVTVTYTLDKEGTLVEGSREDVVPESLKGTELYKLERSEYANQIDPASMNIDDATNMFGLPDTYIRGTSGEDYLLCRYTYNPISTYETDEGGNKVIKSTTYKYVNYYYVVDSSEKKQYSDPVLLFGQIPLAQEDVIGGFYNVPTDAIDNGYVYLDENGRLRLLDYGLLRTGVLAYQLGEDFICTDNSTTEAIQEELDEYVNQRVAFPNLNHMNSSDSDARVININITLPKEEEPVELNIYDIDSRFNTAVCINIYGKADNNTTVNITNCQKVKINNNIQGTPIINVRRSCLYYDAYVIDYIRQCMRTDYTFSGFQDMKLWYEQLESTDPNLTINDMTVNELDAPISAEHVDYWDSTAKNDNHYRYALKSVTFSASLEIIGFSIIVGNDSTNNIDTGHAIIISDFVLPQGQGLTYPKSAITRALKVTGAFVSAYKAQGTWVVTDTNFTALTTTYDKWIEDNNTTGSIAFHSDTNLIPCDADSIPGWDPNSYHIFEGGVIN